MSAAFVGVSFRPVDLINYPIRQSASHASDCSLADSEQHLPQVFSAKCTLRPNIYDVISLQRDIRRLAVLDGVEVEFELFRSDFSLYLSVDINLMRLGGLLNGSGHGNRADQ